MNLQAEKTLNIIYNFINNKKVNGTLFYCFEYFIKCNSLGNRTDFLIFDISEEDLHFIKEIFKSRYNFDESLLDRIIILKKKTDLIKLNYHRTLFLDTRSFRTLFQFVNNTSHEVLCFSNGSHEMLRSTRNKVIFYGSYLYQKFDKEAILKFNFDIFKQSSSKKSNTGLVSAPSINPTSIAHKFDVKEETIIFKLNNFSHGMIFDKFDTLYYYHTIQDTNNRLIPECFWYKKNIVIDFNNVYDDSIYIRYNDIKNNGIQKYNLDSTDIIIQDFTV